MNKQQFMKELNHSLKKLPDEERRDIVQDFEEHFFIGKQEGQSEEDISSSLGSPGQIGKEMLAVYHLDQVQSAASTGNVFRAIWAVAGLSFFNLIIVLGPFIGLLGLLLAGWAAGISFTVSPILVLVELIVTPEASSIFELFMSLTLAGLGLLISFGMLKLTKWLTKTFIWYLHYNMRLVKGGTKYEYR